MRRFLVETTRLAEFLPKPVDHHRLAFGSDTGHCLVHSNPGDSASWRVLATITDDRIWESVSVPESERFFGDAPTEIFDRRFPNEPGEGPQARGYHDRDESVWSLSQCGRA